MATKITTTFVCDECGEETSLSSEIVRYMVTINQGSVSMVKEMDLCANGEGSCAQWLEAQYAQIWRNPPKRSKNTLKEIAHREDEKRCDGMVYACVCGFSSGSNQGLGTHITRANKAAS
jgi:predicted RNA-binding Zn-ribbon protein involved in translation (DUF1610 family)